MIEPDAKDWTRVLDRPCVECGYVAADLDRAKVGSVVRDHAASWGPGVVATEAVQAGERVAAAFDGLDAEQWERRGRRSDGASFTVESFSRYVVHDLVHHAHDVGRHDVRG